MSGLEGSDIGRYHVVEQIGRGGMAVVYRAYDNRLERPVALKVIRRESIGADFIESMLKRFEREAKALAKLQHPNIVGVIDYGEHEGMPYLVMEYIVGGVLKPQAGKPMAWSKAAALLAKVARALDYAHRQGIIHRDVKPSNILVTDDGEPMLSDFGIAKILDAGDGAQLTMTGVGIGTPEYMAPEQWMGKTVPQTDIYALGVVLYELVTGRRPFTADTPAAVLVKQASEALPRPRQFIPDLPEEVEGVLFKALAKNPAERYPTMGEFALALEQLAGAAQPTPQPQTQAQPIPVPQPGQGGAAATPVESKPVTPAEWKRPEPASQPQPSPSQGQEALRRSKAPLLIGGVILAGVLLVGGLAGAAGIGYFLIRPTVTLSPTPAATRPLQPTLSPSQETTSTASPAATATYPPVPTPTKAPVQVATRDGMAQVLVTAGEFLMGSSSSDPYARSNEKPQHKVELDAYWIDKTEVTNGLYTLCVKAGVCAAPTDPGSQTRSNYFNNPNYANYPVINITWNDARAYCQWAGRRLPTEAEWEKAARGSDGRLYPWGNQLASRNLLNYAKNEKDTTAVGAFPLGASPYGALDMAGNVFEFTADWRDDGYYAISPLKNPLGPASGQYRVIRGGCWDDTAQEARSASRSDYQITLNYRNGSLGFRCAADDK